MESAVNILASKTQTPEKLEGTESPVSGFKMLLGGETDGNLLLMQEGALKHYNWETKQSKELLKLSECDITDQTVGGISTLSDGRLAVLVRDWGTEDMLEIAMLNPVPKDQVPEKQTLRLGTVTPSMSSELSAAVANFNKKSSEYRIELVSYSQTDAEEGLQKMNQEIISGNGPDLIDLSYLNENLEAYLEKGILEDLAPYLEASEEISREDFLPNLLESYTVNDTLYAIPAAFQISTVVGRSSEVGEEQGLSIAELMEFAEKQGKESTLFAYESKSLVLQFLLGKGAGNFIDWETGECFFDGEEFRRMLEFSNGYEAESINSSYEEIPQMLKEGKIKLYKANVSRMEDLQLFRNYFDEPITYIGYPVSEGKSGSYFADCGNLLGINSQSEYKEAAWEFISGFLTKETQLKAVQRLSYGFPSRKDALEALFAKAMEANYEYDENGNPVQEIPKLTSSQYALDGTLIETKYYASTQEEVDTIRAVIASIAENDESNYEIADIIWEEVIPYFGGQKTIGETVENIQNRMNLYISERK